METEERQNNIEHARHNASLITVLLPYLASPEEKQLRLAIEVTKYLKVKGELPGELESALEGIVGSADSTKTSPGQQAKVNAAAAVIDIRDNSVQGNGTDLSSLPPRVYIQISREDQRVIAKSLQAKLTGENFLAPGIENVGEKANIPDETEVRYYRNEEKDEALRIIGILKSLNLGLQIKDIPQKIAGSGRESDPGTMRYGFLNHKMIIYF